MGKDNIVESDGILRKQEITQLKSIGNRGAKQEGKFEKAFLLCYGGTEYQRKINFQAKKHTLKYSS